LKAAEASIGVAVSVVVLVASAALVFVVLKRRRRRQERRELGSKTGSDPRLGELHNTHIHNAYGKSAPQVAELSSSGTRADLGSR
jgi:hypothetical protein